MNKVIIKKSTAGEVTITLPEVSQDKCDDCRFEFFEKQEGEKKVNLYKCGKCGWESYLAVTACYMCAKKEEKVKCKGDCNNIVSSFFQITIDKKCMECQRDFYRDRCRVVMWGKKEKLRRKHLTEELDKRCYCIKCQLHDDSKRKRLQWKEEILDND